MTVRTFLQERRSKRQFDTSVIISDEEIKQLLQDAATAPSSNNLQPWQVIAVKNKELQAKISAVSYGQQSVVEASVVFVIFADLAKYNHVKEIGKRMVAEGLIPESEIPLMEEKTKNFFASHPEDNQVLGGALDVGLFSMNLMHVVRAYGYDSVPMRGVDFSAVSHLIDTPKEWVPIMMLPVGKALDDGYQSVRYQADEFLRIIK